MRAHVLETWHLCGRCWALLEIGVPLLQPGSRLDYFTDRRGLLLTAPEVWDSIRMAIRNAFPTRGQLAGKPLAPGEQTWPGLNQPPATP